MSLSCHNKVKDKNALIIILMVNPQIKCLLVKIYTHIITFILPCKYKFTPTRVNWLLRAPHNKTGQPHPRSTRGDRMSEAISLSVTL